MFRPQGERKNEFFRSKRHKLPVMPEFNAEDSVTFGERKPKKGRKRFVRQDGRRAPASEAHTIRGGDNEKSGTSRRGVANATTSLRPKRGKRDVRASQPTYFQCKLTYKVLKTVVFEAFNVNNQCISADSSVLAWKKKWEWLTSHCVFHSIRFKVNKVGIQWYPIFFCPLASIDDCFPFFPAWMRSRSRGTRNSFRAR